MPKIKKSFTLDEKIYKWLAAQAKKERRSVSALLNILIEDCKNGRI